MRTGLAGDRAGVSQRARILDAALGLVSELGDAART